MQRWFFVVPGSGCPYYWRAGDVLACDSKAANKMTPFLERTKAAQFDEVIGAVAGSWGEKEASIKIAKLRGASATAVRALSFDQGSLLDPARMANPADAAVQWKSAVSALDTDTPLTAFAQLSSAWLASLRGFSLAEAVISRALPLPPFIAVALSTGGGSASIVAEGAPKVVSRTTFATDSLTPSKAVALVVLSKELLKFLGPMGNALIGAELRAETALQQDKIAAGVLLDGVSATPSSGDFRTDLRVLLSQVKITQMSAPLLFASPAAVAQLAAMGGDSGPSFPDLQLPSGGQVSGIPLVGCDALASYADSADYLVLVDASQIGADAGNLTIRASAVGSIQMSDSPSGAAQLTSLYQTNSIATIAEREFSIKRLRDNSTAAISGASYSLGSPA